MQLVNSALSLAQLVVTLLLPGSLGEATENFKIWLRRRYARIRNWFRVMGCHHMVCGHSTVQLLPVTRIQESPREHSCCLLCKSMQECHQVVQGQSSHLHGNTAGSIQHQKWVCPGGEAKFEGYTAKSSSVGILANLTSHLWNWTE